MQVKAGRGQGGLCFLRLLPKGAERKLILAQQLPGGLCLAGVPAASRHA